MNKFSLNLRGAMEAHQTSNLGVLSSSLSEDVFYFLPIIFIILYSNSLFIQINILNNSK